MADEKAWDGAWPTAQTFLAHNDALLLRKANNAGAQVLGDHIIARRAAGGPYYANGDAQVAGVITGGLGAQGTTLGEPDWNGAGNARAGQGVRLMGPSDANGPPRGLYFHPLSFEYSVTKTGGNLTQFAVPYYDQTGYFGLRFKFNSTWSPWRAILMEDSSGRFLPSSDNINSLGSASIRFSTVFAGSGTINTSDERQKSDISDVPDDWLDAWGDVNWCRFRFNGGRRWHVGLIAQRVHAAFAARGLDAFDIGLCCFDQWAEERAPILDEAGNHVDDGEVTRPAGDLWGLRYDECFAMEAAWVRRELARIVANAKSASEE